MRSAATHPCFALLGCVILVSVVTAASAGSRVKDRIDGYLDVLESKSGNSGITALKSLLNQPVKSFKQSDVSWAADSVISGFDFIAFEAQAYAHIKVSEPASLLDVRGALGAPREREQLTNTMLQLAADISKADPESAKRLARAAVLIRAADSPTFSPFNILKWLDAPQGPSAFLAEPTVARLRSIETKFMRGWPDRVSDSPAVRISLALAEMIKLDKWDQASSQQLDRICDTLASAFGWGLSAQEAHVLLSMAWQTRCLLESWKAQEGIRQLTQTLEQLNQSTAHPLIRRWIEEAGALPGPKPAAPSMRVIRHANELKDPDGP